MLLQDIFRETIYCLWKDKKSENKKCATFTGNASKKIELL